MTSQVNLLGQRVLTTPLYNILEHSPSCNTVSHALIHRNIIAILVAVFSTTVDNIVKLNTKFPRRLYSKHERFLSRKEEDSGDLI